MRGEKSKCSLEFYVIVSVTIETYVNKLLQLQNLPYGPAMANLRKLPDMIIRISI